MKMRTYPWKEGEEYQRMLSTFQTTMTLDVPFGLKIILGDDLMAVPPLLN